MERLNLTILGSGIFKKKVFSLPMSLFGLLCQKERGENREKDGSLLIFSWWLYGGYLGSQLFCYGFHNFSSDSVMWYGPLQSDNVMHMLACVF